MRLIDADELKEWVEKWFTMNRNWHPYSKSNNIPITELYDILERMPSSQPELYGYPIEHLEMIARVMEKENCTPEAVAQMLQNAGKVAKMVRDKMMEMLNESIEKSCKGEANE